MFPFRLSYFYVQGKYEEAGRLHERAVEMFEAALGKEHTLVAFGLRHWALLLKTQVRWLT